MRVDPDVVSKKLTYVPSTPDVSLGRYPNDNVVPGVAEVVIALPVMSAGGYDVAKAPVAPVAPVGPVAPSAPASPVGPVTPSAPASPVGPVDPVSPVGPVIPVAPVGPWTPVGPMSMASSVISPDYWYPVSGPVSPAPVPE